MQRRSFLRIAPASLLPSFGLAAAPSQAGQYPERPVTLVVAYTAGGSADQRMRQIGKYLATSYSQPFIVENKPGAGGNIGTELIARAKPDGYTLGMGNLAPLAVNPALFKAKSFDPQRELGMIALIERGPLLLVVKPDAGYRTVADVIAAAKNKPGGLSYGSSGAGSSHHLCGELLKSITGANITHIPYKGGASAIVDLMGGQLDFMFEPMYSAVPAVRAGKLRALAITTPRRSALMPELPTMAESGVPGFHVENWQGLVGPAGLPEPIVRSLNSAVNQALVDPTIRAQMLGQGNEVGGGTPQDFAALVKSEAARWSQVVAQNKIVAQ
jgi:tripartite-type tricarboxylate transporter receptor subunit TctC